MPVQSGLDLLMALLYAQNAEPIKGTLRLTKLLFLLVQEGGFGQLEREYAYEPYDFGPWTPRILDYASALEQRDLVKIEQEDFQHPEEIAHEWAEYSPSREEATATPRWMATYYLTERGLRVAEILYHRLKPNERESLDLIKRRFGRISQSELVQYVYSRYPQYASKSKLVRRKPRRSMFGIAPDLAPFKEDQEDVQ